MADFIFSVIFIFFALFGIFEMAGSIFRFLADRKEVEEHTYIVTEVPKENTEIFIRDFLCVFEDHENLIMISDSDETNELLKLFQRTHPNMTIAENFSLGEKRNG